MQQGQVDGINMISHEWTDVDMNQLAYVLATVYHETGRKMQPVKEFGSEEYLRSKKYYPYYGRDLVQTTWKHNYEKVKQFSRVDVVSSPDLIARMPLAAQVAITFMKSGWYTGKRLSDYINHDDCDFFHARKIINGLDCADKIAGYALKFQEAMNDE